MSDIDISVMETLLFEALELPTTVLPYAMAAIADRRHAAAIRFMLAFLPYSVGLRTLYQIRGGSAAGVVTTKYTKYTKHGPVAGPVPACLKSCQSC
jgi:hypothetical protein